MELVARQFLRAVRGRRSQLDLALRLGYQGNPVTDWERGVSFPTARETLRICETLGIDVERALLGFARVPITRDHGGHRVGSWLRAISSVSVAELARRTGCGRSSVARWFTGRTQPKLPEFLRLVDGATGRLVEFVAAFVPMVSVPALSERATLGRAEEDLAFHVPFGEALQSLLRTTAYRSCHRDVEWMARVLDIAPAEVSDTLDVLLRSGRIRREGAHYVVAAPCANPLDSALLRELETHWSNVAADRALVRREGDLHAYDVVAVSATDLRRIRELLCEVRRQIHSIVAASEPCETVALVNLHLFEWQPWRPPEGESTPPPE